ncbi:LA2681 family HEPN domain-containing protein [Marinomonas sp. TW1]|uniref:LA2681 family HEPN domain-containing protein n=1 Tax=Marinomonas sp. TW1 TaxID=1561203 RepID=UPI0007AF1214|nr:LA2681 family HEPN domain-containing protein [Marinomonas sp. TW1]KZN15184.1 hypothetical protein OA79_03030 [Marinomonas sp. TW1]
MEDITNIEDLHQFIDDNPKDALAYARKFAKKALSEEKSLSFLQAHKLSKVLIDAGEVQKDIKSIDCGIGILRHLVSLVPKEISLLYDLATGLQCKAKLTSENDNYFNWLQDTHHLRMEARAHHYRVAFDKGVDDHTRSLAFSNIANLHSDSYRTFEAYEYFRNALALNPKNGLASFEALRIAVDESKFYETVPEELTAQIGEYAQTTLNNRESTIAIAGKAAFENMKSYIEANNIEPSLKIRSEITATPYSDFITLNNLRLSCSLVPDSSEDDDLSIDSIYSSSDYDVPETFTMFNVMKGDYLLARHLFWNASQTNIEDSSLYNESVPYGEFGTNISALQTAQKIALDILDKIAVATFSYFKIGGARKAYFKKAWFKDSPNDERTTPYFSLKVKPKVQSQIEQGNPYLLALVEMARDLAAPEGYLRSHSDNRNAITHRFLVLQDTIHTNSSTSDCVAYSPLAAFQDGALVSIKLARSALYYFVEMINFNETRKAVDLESGDIVVMTHIDSQPPYLK